MVEQRANPNSLPVPPVAQANPAARETLRVWVSPDDGTQVVLSTTWKDPAAWGILLVDVARHAAKAYAREGHDPDEALMRIRELWDAEWSEPTGGARDITPGS